MTALGIDLGTTHSAVARCAPGKAPTVLPIHQRTSATATKALPLLPSALYAPLDGECPERPGEVRTGPWVAGMWARDRAAEAPERAITSIKSWLCHAGVDRHSAILPWASGLRTKLSPVEASTHLLRHIAAAAGGEPKPARTILTIPASFDEVARQLTIEAAAAAGMDPILLEEPQAAFYYWMRHNRRALHKGTRVLVCDVGGGTTDFSLLEVLSPREVRRIAVGDHLLLGGENMDLALAHLAEKKLPQPLSPAMFQSLVHACRAAKERLLSDNPLEEFPIAVASTGATLVGSVTKVVLSRAEVEQAAATFFPPCASEKRQAQTGSGLRHAGLPFERNPAITEHLATFLQRHDVRGGSLSLLFNGGVFHSLMLRACVTQALRAWGFDVTELPLEEPDLAVALGAAIYGDTLESGGVKIGGGSARAFFMETSASSRAPAERMGVCVLPRGAEPGEVFSCPTPVTVRTGQASRFVLWSTTQGAATVGEVLPIAPTFAALPPLATLVPASGGPSESPAKLETELTEIGTIRVFVLETERRERARHLLSFESNQGAAAAKGITRVPSTKPPPVAGQHADLGQAEALVSAAFARNTDPRGAKNLLRELEGKLGERRTWSLETCRPLWDALISAAANRKQSSDHERVFWLLAGFLLRPGVGHPADSKRIGRLCRLFSERVVHDESRIWQQYWIAWRRVASGLDDAFQLQVHELLAPLLAPASARAKKPKGFSLQSPSELLEMLSALERVPPDKRKQLVDWLLDRTWTDSDPRLWEALARLGARMPFYASAHFALPSQTAATLVEHFLREDWSRHTGARRIALTLARRTGDRSRDLPEALIQEVRVRMVKAGALAEELRPLDEVVPLSESEQVLFYGEALPVGIRLRSP